MRLSLALFFFLFLGRGFYYRPSALRRAIPSDVRRSAGGHTDGISQWLANGGTAAKKGTFFLRLHILTRSKYFSALERVLPHTSFETIFHLALERVLPYTSLKRP
jgi:hypothetical protein